MTWQRQGLWELMWYGCDDEPICVVLSGSLNISNCPVPIFPMKAMPPFLPMPSPNHRGSVGWPGEKFPTIRLQKHFCRGTPGDWYRAARKIKFAEGSKSIVNAQMVGDTGPQMKTAGYGRHHQGQDGCICLIPCVR